MITNNAGSPLRALGLNLALALGVAVASTGCGGRDSRTVMTPEQALLLENQTKWEVVALEDFTYTLSRSCFCMREGPWQIVYVGGELQERTDLDGNGSEVGPTEIPATVDELFAVLERAYKDDAAEVRVQYHPDYGLPLSIAIDWLPQAVDDEMSWSISDFSAADAPL